jgi:hypothetical protein
MFGELISFLSPRSIAESGLILLHPWHRDAHFGISVPSLRTSTGQLDRNLAFNCHGGNTIRLHIVCTERVSIT